MYTFQECFSLALVNLKLCFHISRKINLLLVCVALEKLSSIFFLFKTTISLFLLVITVSTEHLFNLEISLFWFGGAYFCLSNIEKS